MDFEWDNEKALANARKHDIDFKTASLVFLDPGRLEEYDKEHSTHEDRWMSRKR